MSIAAFNPAVDAGDHVERVHREVQRSEQSAGGEIGEAKTEAADDKRADYKVAVEKCDRMSGDAKTNCLTTAKARFGKN